MSDLPIFVCPCCRFEGDMFKMGEHFESIKNRKHQKLAGKMQDEIEDAAMVAEMDAQQEFMEHHCTVKL